MVQDKTATVKSSYAALAEPMEQMKRAYISVDPFFTGAPGAIRTPDPLVRSQVLYPAELRAHMSVIALKLTLPKTLAEREGFEPSVRL